MARKRHRIFELSRKLGDGTLTDEEIIDLKCIIRESFKGQYEECPACGGAFEKTLSLEEPLKCPQCENVLESFCGDIVPHCPSEIDDSLDPNEILGEFISGFMVSGTRFCVSCLLTYPKSYTCCPGLFSLALELHEFGTESERQKAIAFIDRNSATLTNALRGSFRKLFRPESIGRMFDLACQFQWSEELRGVLEEIQSETYRLQTPRNP
jgi:hypothetical protein